jgi:hypothetical protein
LRFFYHYNKPSSKKAGKPQIIVHIKKTCHIVDNIVVKVPTEGRIRKQQPFFVIVGDASSYEIKNGIMYLE